MAPELTGPGTARTPSPVTVRATAFVSAQREVAERLGADLADHLHDPDAFATALHEALAALADPEYLDGQRSVAPGLGRIHGVRAPLLDAVARGFRRETEDDPAGSLLYVADRLLRETHLEPRWFAFELLGRTLGDETERTWQLLRRAARAAGDWITVDRLAEPYADGITAEPYRWAELELLVYSPSRWERRLVGSTIATLTHGARAGRGSPSVGAETARRALPILAELIGDAEPDVQKALSWAYRSLADRDREATTAELRAQADVAAANDDGHRAWVIRDSLAKLAASDADDLRARLSGIRRRPGASSTSNAAATAAMFGDVPDPATHPEPPLT